MPTTNSMIALITAILPIVTLGHPTASTNLHPRAGGPAIVPIPPNCTVTSPLPTSPSASYIPAPNTNNDILYRAYYTSFSSNKTAMAEQCLQQCYGYGTHTECKTAYWAENIPISAGYHGSPGGDLATGCLMFKRTLGPGDFVVAPEGQATDAFAGSIACLTLAELDL